ncbi:MAG: fibronectin type III domain-containing protein [Muribaculaceae bacterium]|nr:fibronectin type III domain-containing protein [Muribaculaceae bacterium]
MRLIITTAIAAFMGFASAMAGPARSASLENLRVKGVLMYDNDKNNAKLGLYSYSVTNPVERRLLIPVTPLYANGGSVVVDNKLYTFNGQIDYGWVSSAYYYVYDLTTGERISSKSMGYDLGVCYSHMATSSAVDPTDGTVYCSGYDYDEAGKLLYVKLKTWDVENNTKTTVGDMQAPLIAMAFDNDGRLWGITSSSSTTSTDGGFLVKVDKTTGNQTLIGDTGVRPYYDQCAIINPADGTFYWFANTQTEQATIYTVDLTTGAATIVGDLPNGDEVVAPTINPEEYDDNAPSAPAPLSLTTAPDYKLTLSFDMPVRAYDGSELSGELAWTAEIKGSESSLTCSGTADAGANVSETVDLSSSQQAEVTVRISRGDITGPETVGNVYVGYDKMKAVSNLKLEHTDGVSTLTWDAPAEGCYNGLQHADGLRYIIRRMPENEVVASAHNSTTFTETITDDTLRSTFYTVAAVNGDVEGEAASSNSVVTGASINPPYSQDFDLSNALDLYTIVDANKDNNTWYYSVKSAKYRQSTSSSADDYLFTPCFNLSADCSYELSFDGYGTNARYVNLLDIVLARAPEADGAEVITDEPFSYSNTSTSVVNNKIIISPETDGKYYIGFHLTSAKSMGTFTIDNVVLSAGKSTAVPATPASLSATAGAEGALNARISVVAPDVTAAGDPLGDELLSLTLLRGDTEVYTADIAPGATAEFVDDNITDAGNYTYTATFANAKGAGEPSSVNVFIGTDTPAAPAEVTITDNNDGTALVSWTPASEGLNGGYIDLRKMVYNVIDATGKEVIKGGIRINSATIDIPSEGSQAIYSVKVAAAYSDDALTPATSSNEILSGMPYTLPYAESFAGATAATSPWIKEVVSGKSSDTSWAARADNTQDNDGGAADMTAYSAAASRWAGPKIDISEAVEPVASAYVYLPGGNTRFTLQAQKDNGEWVNLASVDRADEDWVEVTAPLTEHKSKNVRLGLLGECLGGMHFIYVDNIKVHDKSSGIDNVTLSGTEVSVTTCL